MAIAPHVYTDAIIIGGRTYTRSQTKSSSGLVYFGESIGDQAEDAEYAYQLDVSTVISFFLCASGVLTIKTNSSSTPDYTFITEAYTPISWHESMRTEFFLADDVTTLFITNTENDASVDLVVSAYHYATLSE